MVFVSIISYSLYNKSFKRFVKANIKDLNKSSTSSRNIRGCTVQLFKFVINVTALVADRNQHHRPTKR
jgi:hypothetical protein